MTDRPHLRRCLCRLTCTKTMPAAMRSRCLSNSEHLAAAASSTALVSSSQRMFTAASSRSRAVLIASMCSLACP